MRAGKVISAATYAVLTVSVAAAVYVMVRHLGLIDGLDFGCGQYYYTDIPGWERFFSVDRFKDSLPIWVYFVLFFLWGYAMYRLWAWLDARPERDAGGAKEAKRGGSGAPA